MYQTSRSTVSRDYLHSLATKKSSPDWTLPYRLGFDPTLEREPLIRLDSANDRSQYRLLPLFYSIPRIQQCRVQVRLSLVVNLKSGAVCWRIWWSYSNKYFRSTPLEYPLVTLSGYLRFWAVAFIVVTAYLAYFQPEVSCSVLAISLWNVRLLNLVSYSGWGRGNWWRGYGSEASLLDYEGYLQAKTWVFEMLSGVANLSDLTLSIPSQMSKPLFSFISSPSSELQQMTQQLRSSCWRRDSRKKI